jgi:hypothetical protein
MRWEHKVEHVDVEEAVTGALQMRLDARGDEGWELVSVRKGPGIAFDDEFAPGARHSGVRDSLLLFFKQPDTK